MIISDEIQIKRYAAFYRGWCQAFGEHDGEIEESADINWIYSDVAIGMVMSPSLQKRFMRHLLGKENAQPRIILASRSIKVGEEWISLESETDVRGLGRMQALLNSGLLIHMYMSSHFYYPAGTRIITLSTRKPLPIMYREISPLYIQLSD
ncbi:MAG: hypothetical protein R3312_04005 [Gammaproteobacteria bacterium]|nr:hypothetical protein [Gammaproteobacteria bacterium]